MRPLNVKETQRTERVCYVFCSENMFWSPGAQELAIETYQHPPKERNNQLKDLIIYICNFLGVLYTSVQVLLDKIVVLN